MTRLLCMVVPKNCQQARDLSQAYREATANAGIMEPPRDTGKPLLSLQEVESRLVFARCKPFTLATPGRQWLVLIFYISQQTLFRIKSNKIRFKKPKSQLTFKRTKFIKNENKV